jgi:hypothetical protein
LIYTPYIMHLSKHSAESLDKVSPGDYGMKSKLKGMGMNKETILIVT